jgi:hypothetical protein
MYRKDFLSMVEVTKWLYDILSTKDT